MYWTKVGGKDKEIFIFIQCIFIPFWHCSEMKQKLGWMQLLNAFFPKWFLPTKSCKMRNRAAVSVLLENVSHFHSSHVWMLTKVIKKTMENSNCWRHNGISKTWKVAQQILSCLEDIWTIAGEHSAFQRWTAMKEFGQFYLLLHVQVGRNGVIHQTEGLSQYDWGFSQGSAENLRWKGWNDEQMLRLSTSPKPES